MNIIKNYTKVLALTAFAFGAVALTSCEDEPDKYKATGGVPTVKYIRCLATEVVGNNDSPDMHYTNGELVTSAGPGNTICLLGDNMRSVHEIYFNDLKASLNPNYITDNTLIVSVPGAVPNLVTDKIYLVTTGNDTVNVDFKVKISAPVVNGMKCEYAKPGDEEVLRGNYFINDPNVPLTINFTGADGKMVPAKIGKIADDYTSVEFTVPEGAAEGPIYVTSIYGTSKTSFEYMDHRGMIFDFDSPNGISDVVLDMHAWNGHTCTTDATAISGNFWQFGADGVSLSGAPDTGWPDEGQHSFAYWPGNWEDPETFKEYPRLYDLVNMSDWANMSLKFEMYIPKSHPWAGGAMHIVFAGTDLVTNGGGGIDAYGNTIHVQDNSYLNGDGVPHALYRPWTNTTDGYDTDDKWVTVTLPLAASFIYAHDGTAARSSMSKDTFGSIWMALYGGGVEGKDCTPIIKIDNIRLVPNK